MKFCTIKCSICNGVLLNLPESEIEHLNGLTFRCECCGHRLILEGTNAIKAVNEDPRQNIYSYDFML